MASAPPSRVATKVPRSPESYESLFRRNAAAEILQSYEKLSWYSFQRCESLVQTRLHFQNVVAGLTEEDEAGLVDWHEDRTARPKANEDRQGSRSGNEHVSLGNGGGDGVAGSSAHKSGKGREHSDGGASSASQQAKRKKKKRVSAE